ncbi:Aldo/keto reductase [Testicularia cyperi]|uniref:Aldo/keto reductase n=1 Tax=Testicularia cyperi TaxID=1882483 RepID=A0A317XQL6_9BASI|nr:Aldo/keto reductase [Testicularia cyperi]
MASNSSYPTRPLGGSAKSIHIGRIAFGCMGMTWVDPKHYTPDQQAFETIKAAVDAGSNLLNSGAFYGPPSDPYANLKLLRRFFDAHPDYKSKTVLSVKGGMNVAAYSQKGMPGLQPDASVQHLEADLAEIRNQLGSDHGGKHVDIYEMARIDPSTEIEDVMYNMLSLSSQTYTDKSGNQQTGKGLFDHISLSEVGLDSIKRASAVAPIACIEIEVSPWERSAYDMGIVDFCSQQHVPILAYSPTGKGMLAGTIQSPDDIPEGDPRKHMDRLAGENFTQNLKLAHEFRKAAEAHNPPVTPTQLGLAWLIQSSPDPTNPVIVPLPGTSKAARARENAQAATLHIDAETKSQIDSLISGFQVAGGRYNEAARQHSKLWG